MSVKLPSADYDEHDQYNEEEEEEYNEQDGGNIRDEFVDASEHHNTHTHSHRQSVSSSPVHPLTPRSID
jgi:hypothetical protein